MQRLCACARAACLVVYAHVCSGHSTWVYIHATIYPHATARTFTPRLTTRHLHLHGLLASCNTSRQHVTAATPSSAATAVASTLNLSHPPVQHETSPLAELEFRCRDPSCRWEQWVLQAAACLAAHRGRCPPEVSPTTKPSKPLPLNCCPVTHGSFEVRPVPRHPFAGES